MDNKSPDAFRTISEVADWLGVPAHVLRFWESRFGQVKPVKRAGGRRYYRPSDMELLGGIRKLLHEDGLTIRGVQKLLRENGIKYVAAMSPPIDQSANLKDVSASSAATREVEAVSDDSRSDHDAPSKADTLGDRAAPILDTNAEDAVEIAPTPEPTSKPTGEPGSSPTAHAPEAHAPEAHATDDQDSAPQIDAETIATADRVDSADTGGTAPEDAETEDEEADETFAAPPPFDSPEAIEFYAHEAQPETAEHAAPSREASDSETVPPAQETEIEAPQADGTGPSHGISEPGTDSEVAAHADSPGTADDAASSIAAPTSPDTAAVEARVEAPEGDATYPETPEHAPELTAEQAPEQTPEQTKVVAQEEVPQAPAPTEPPLAEVEDAAGGVSSDAVSAGSESVDREAPAQRDTDGTPRGSAAGPEQAIATAPDVVMPKIGADPEDDDVIPTTPAVAAALRRQRFRAIVGPADADLDPAQLKAQLDRLQALSGRLGGAPDRRRAF